MIKPVNGHLLIEPVSHETFISSQRETYEEIGVVLDIADLSGHVSFGESSPVNVGDRVYFDSWLAARYPKNESEYYWLVKWEDVRAIEHE